MTPPDQRQLPEVSSMVRVARRSLWLLLFTFLAFLFAWEVLYPMGRYIVEKRNGPQLLAAASEAQLDEAVGPLGCVLRFPDGSWLAIRYVDSHAAVDWSLAIARDSDGGWHESTHHFCGHLKSILQHVALAPDLPTARQRLTSVNFKTKAK